MKELITNIITMWNRYWGSGIYQYLLLAAALFLLIRRRKKDSTRQALSYLIMVLFLFAFPVSAYIIQKCIGASVYWRTLWLLPTFPVIALAGTELLSGILGRIRMNRKLQNTLLTLLFAVTAVFCFRGMMQSEEYVRVHNYQKVPEEVAQICNLVRAHAGEGEEILLAADEHVASYVRVYDPSIDMPYGRRRKGALDRASRTLHKSINSGRYRYKIIFRAGQKKSVDYLVVPVVETFDEAVMKEYGYELIGEINQYGIFYLTEELPANAAS